MDLSLRMFRLFALFIVVIFGLALASQEVLQKKTKPNIVFILTDDQDLHMDSLSYMPHLKNHLTQKGTHFTRHYCTVALCCPSRVSLWTGKAAHNTNVTDVNPPYGGYPKFISQGFNKDYFPLWMQNLGYNTYYVGKLFNAHTVDNYASPPAAGWTGSEFLLDPYTYQYLNATFTRNGAEPVNYAGRYSTDLVASKSFGFLDDALKAKKPFFLTIAPTAPHSNVQIGSNLIDGNFTRHTNVQSPPVSAPRHAHLFADATVPRTPHFNPEQPHGVSWIGRLPKQNETNVEANDHFYRQRLRALQSVDEIVDELVRRLEDAGVLEETYIFFSTDNGYHIGQHRLQPGKQCAFEEDINIPLIVRGPGVAKNHSTDLVTTHTDLAPTFLQLAGGHPDTTRALQSAWDGFDGAPIPLEAFSARGGAEQRTEHVNVEMWGIILSEGEHGAVLYPNHTYKALRVIGAGYDLLYTVWCSGEHELYDLRADPYETENLLAEEADQNLTASTVVTLGPFRDHVRDSDGDGDVEDEEEERVYRSELQPPGLSMPADNVYHAPPLPSSQSQSQSSSSSSSPSTASSPAPLKLPTTSTKHQTTLAHLVPRLDSLLQVLRTCQGAACTHPWHVLHPRGDVANLRDALHERYDDFYEVRQQDYRVRFDRCEQGYILESEGPRGVRPYLEGIGG